MDAERQLAALRGRLRKISSAGIEPREDLDSPEDESIEEEEVIDLTQEPQEWNDADRSTGYEADDVLVWAPPKPGLLARQRRGLLGNEDEEEDDPE